MTAAWPQGACGYLAKALVAALVMAVVSVAGPAALPGGAAAQAEGVSSLGGPGAGTGSDATAGEQPANLGSTSSAAGGLTLWCTTTTSYVNPELLDLLASQYQSGPVRTVTCVPAAVGGDGAVTALSVCTVSNTYATPGLLDVLATQYQSGPVQTMTCVPAAAGDARSAGGAVTVLPACIVTETYTTPGLLGLLAPQFQSGPVQTVTCVPAAIVTQDPAGRLRGRAVADASDASQGPGASALAATGPARSPVRGLSVLLISLGVLGLGIARATARSPFTPRS